jgi:hypothetical protein
MKVGADLWGRVHQAVQFGFRCVPVGELRPVSGPRPDFGVQHRFLGRAGRDGSLHHKWDFTTVLSHQAPQGLSGQ